MRIFHNVLSLEVYRFVNQSSLKLANIQEKLASGLQISRAADDAAGLSISERMRAQIVGLNQAARNTQDAISLIQTAEGGMNEVHSLLQRGRELSVQAANDTLTKEDKKKVQNEIKEILKEVDRIANTTEFNTKKLLNKGPTLVQTAPPPLNAEQKVIDALQRSMLEQAEKMVKNLYGLQGDNTTLKVVLDASLDGAGGTLALVRASVTGNVAKDLELHVDMADFPSIVWPNGGTSPNYLDRTVAHEMVHAVFFRSLNMNQDVNGNGVAGEQDRAVSTWFQEGAAEFIHGADDRLLADIQNKMANNGGNLADAVNTIVNFIPNDGNAWTQVSESYSAGYAAVKYLDYTLRMATGGTEAGGIVTGGTLGFKDFLQELYHGGLRDRTMDDAFAAINTAAGGTLGFTSMATFLAKFKGTGAGDGQDYIITKLYNTGLLTNADTGSIGGSDYDPSNPELNSEQVVSDTDHLTTTPLLHFKIVWPDNVPVGTSPTPNSDSILKMHIGANEGITLDVALSNVTSESLGITNIDVVEHAQQAITSFEKAIEAVSSERSRLGAIQNRLEYTLNNLINAQENITAAESRIRDADMAKMMMESVKYTIILQAAQAMFTQANQSSQQVLQLLR